MVDCHRIAWLVIGISRFAVAILRNDGGLGIATPPHYNVGIIFNTRVAGESRGHCQLIKHVMPRRGKHKEW